MLFRIPENTQTQGIMCVIGAMILIALQDATVKVLSGTYALHQIVFVRSTIALLITVILVQYEGGFSILKTPFWRTHIIRGLLLVLANMSYYLGLAAMPLTNTVALFFIAPVFITALSIPMLGERVDISRWGAIILGMLGTIIMLRPGSGVFKFVSLLPVLAAASYAMMQILTRKIGLRDRASTMIFYVQLTFFIISGLIGLIAGNGRFEVSGHPSMQFLLRPWIMPSFEDALALILIGVFIGVIAYLLTQAYRLTAASVVAPFEYINLPIALLLSISIWGDWPDASSIVGITLIIVGGLLVLKGKQPQYSHNINTNLPS